MAYDKSSWHMKVHKKKLQKAKDKKRQADAKLTLEELEAKRLRKYEKSTKDYAQLIIWDFEHHQLPATRFESARSILLNRLAEIREENANYNSIEEIKIKITLQKLEGD